MSALIVRTRPAPPPARVAVVGEIDIVTAAELRDHVLTVPDGDVVLDVSGVRFLAAAGLTALLDLHDSRVRAGARLVLAAPSRSVCRVLTLTGHRRTMPVTATVEEAVALLDGAAVRGRAAALGASAKGHDGHHELGHRCSPEATQQRNDGMA